jgi:hypothetical protein
MTQVPAKGLTAGRPDDQDVTVLRFRCEKYPRTGDARVPGEFVRSLDLTGTSRVISRFNRQTEALAALVVSALVSAALLFAVVVEERHAKLADLKGEGNEAGGHLLPEFTTWRGVPIRAGGTNKLGTSDQR